jgi:hypothetical protein
MFAINCTWGIIQSFVGFIIFVRYIKRPHFWYKGSIVTTNSVPKFIGGASVGIFIFLTEDVKKADSDSHMILRHEYGHFLQSLLLGPLYLFAIGIPSVLKNNFVENWADKWGKADRRLQK